MEDLGVLLAQRVHICCVPHPLPVGGGGGDPFWDGPCDTMQGDLVWGGSASGPGPYHRGHGSQGGNEPSLPPV